MEWVTLKCGTCGEQFQITSELYAVLKRSEQEWHCPHGHKRYFPLGPSREKLLEQERDRLKQDNAYQRDRRLAAESEAEHQRARANGYKGHATKLGKRIKAGVCPCCNRTVSQLARHMETEHPNYEPTPEEIAT